MYGRIVLKDLMWKNPTRSDKDWDMLFHGKLSVQIYLNNFYHAGERNGRLADGKAVNGGSFSARGWSTEEFLSFLFT